MLKFSTSFALDVLQQPLALLKSFSAEDAQSIAVGILNAPISGLTPQQGLSVFNQVFPVLLVGGLDNMDGALPAALVLGVASALAAIFIPTYYNLVPNLIMVIVMFFKPNGLFARKEG